MANHPRSAASIVATACTLSACHAASPAPRDSAASTQAAESTHAPAIASNSTIASASTSVGVPVAALPDVPVPTSVEVTTALAPLFQHPAWSRFRAAWRKLDPLTESTGNDRLQSVASECEQSLKKIAQIEGVATQVPGLVAALERVTNLRVSVLRGLKMHLMVMHRLPSPHEVAAARHGELVEERIDALIALRKRNVVSDAEIEQVMQSIVSEMLLAVFATDESGHDGPLIRDPNIQQSQGAERDIDPGILRIHELKAEAKRLEPYLKAIVIELER